MHCIAGRSYSNWEFPLSECRGAHKRAVSSAQAWARPPRRRSGILLEQNAMFALDRLVGLRRKDTVLVISDPTADLNVLAALKEALGNSGASYAVVSVPKVVEMGVELPAPIDSALALADVAVLVSAWFPAWVATKAFWRAVHEYGTRVLHIDPPHRLVLEEGMTDADLVAVAECGHALQERIEGATGLLIADRFGNELRCDIDSRNCHVSADFPLEFGFSKLPTGVFTASVLPGTYEGRIRSDAVEGFPMRDGDFIEVDAKGGVVTGVRGRGAGKDHVAEKVSVSAAFAQLTEWGVGTNPSISEERFLQQPWHEAANRSAGIIHFGLGSAHTVAGAAGRVPYHTHLVARKATVYALPASVPLVLSGRIQAGPAAKGPDHVGPSPPSGGG